MRASHFWKKCNEALVDTFSLVGVRVTRVLVEECPVNDIPELVSLLKSWVAYWLPLVLGDDTPPQKVTDPYSLLSGPFRSFWRNRMTGKGKNRRLRLAALMLYSKRLFPPLPESLVKSKIREYGDALQRPPPSFYPYSHRIEESIDSSVHEIGEMVADYTKPFSPSTSSCYESSRREGGVQGYVRNFVLPDYLQENPFLSKVEDLVDKMSDVQLLSTNWDSLWSDLLVELIDHAESLENGGDPYNARVAGIPEPLKVRLVTRQSWVLNLLKPIQKAWHSKMRRLPVYELIGGKPVSQSIFELRLAPGQQFV
jgi:hypothetical protein